MYLDLNQLCTHYGIVPKGVIHIGAHEGQEIKDYQFMGIPKIVFVEANPVVYKRLEEKMKPYPHVQTASCAISNTNGTISFHVTSKDKSSSILPLKRHQEIYPDIVETDQIVVPCKTLDTLFKEFRLSPSDYNLLVFDIQGAELLALHGAIETLKHIDGIVTEVNFEELYEGCGLIEQVDAFLKSFRLLRVATNTPYHPSWGDAFYVKSSLGGERNQV